MPRWEVAAHGGVVYEHRLDAEVAAAWNNASRATWPGCHCRAIVTIGSGGGGGGGSSSSSSGGGGSSSSSAIGVTLQRRLRHVAVVPHLGVEAHARNHQHTVLSCRNSGWLPPAASCSPCFRPRCRGSARADAGPEVDGVHAQRVNDGQTVWRLSSAGKGQRCACAHMRRASDTEEAAATS